MALPRPELLDLSVFLAPERIHFLPAGTSKTEALEQLAALCGAAPAVRDPDLFIAAIHERERVSSTGIGNGIAVPHAKLQSIDGFVLAVGVCANGIPFEARDDLPVSIMVMIAASDQLRDQYLKVLATVATRLKNEERCQRIRSTDDSSEVIAALSSD